MQQLGLSIIRGELKPYDILPNENDLIEQFGVSRTVIREALMMLSAKGLVEARQKRGTRVLPRQHWSMLDPVVLAWQHEADLDQQGLKDLSEVRRIIEPAAAGLAAIRASDEEIAALEHAYQQMEMGANDPEKYIAADMEFHTIIFTSCRNELLQHIVKTISTVLLVSREVSVQLPGGTQASLPLHKAILDRIREHDEPGATSRMQELIEATAADIARVLNVVEQEPSQ